MNEVLDRIERELTPAIARHNARRRRRRVPLAVAAASVVTVAGLIVALAPGLGGHDETALANARNALSARGSIVYLRISFPSSVGTSTATTTTEQWYTDDPARWRVVSTIPIYKRPRGAPKNWDRALLRGRIEASYADGNYRLYQAGLNRMTITSGIDARSPDAAPPGPLGGDPATRLRDLLASKSAEDLGLVDVHGRQLHRLVTTRRLEQTTWRLVYDVDPTTFAPISADLTISAPGVKTPATHFTVSGYRRLPINARTRGLLVIKTTPSPRIVRKRAP